ncbi:MAG: complex I subunit 5 family protein [Pseudomonadota bacterium]
MIFAVLIGLPLAVAGLAALAPLRWQACLALGPATVVALTAGWGALDVLGSGPRLAALGGFDPPLGIALVLDGPGLVMILLSSAVMAAVVGTLVRQPEPFPRAGWPLLHLAWGGLNTLFTTADVFNAYVALEVTSLAGIALIGVGGTPKAAEAQIRYLLLATLGGLVYLLGVALLYGAAGRLDVGAVAAIEPGSPVLPMAVACVTLGLLVKMAAWPFHVWLPPAHGGAIAPVSALLSALVVKAPAFLLLRFWTDAFAPLALPAAGTLLGALGAAAILWGSLRAMHEPRVKRVVAYSTVAQLGYLLLVVPLAAGGGPSATLAWQGGMVHALTHGLAKAGLFLAAGSLIVMAGGDRVRDLVAIGRAAPLLAASIGLGVVSLMGLPPSLGFVGKWLLLRASLESGQWWWAVPIVGGGLLAAAYGFRLVAVTFRPGTGKRRRALRAAHRPGLTGLAFALVGLPVLLFLAAAPVGRLIGATPGYGGLAP